MNPLAARSIWFTFIMRNRSVPRVPTYDTSTTVSFQSSCWTPNTYCCMYGVVTFGSKNNGCSFRLFGGVRTIEPGVVNWGTPLLIVTPMPSCGTGRRADFRNSFSRRTRSEPAMPGSDGATMNWLSDVAG